MRKIIYLGKELKCVIELNIKLMLHNKTSFFVCGVICILFFLLTGDLALHAEERSSIPIGIIDEDESKMSRQLIQELQENESIYVYVTDKKTAKGLLYKQRIMAYYEINTGFQKNILKGTAKNLINVNYQKNNENISFISDIIAGHIMFDVCLNKSIRVYQSMGSKYKITSEEEYRTFLQKLRTDQLFNFRFDISFIRPNDREIDISQNKLGNSLLYQQALIGTMGFLLSFLILFLVYGMAEPHNRVNGNRVKITMIPRAVIYLGQVLTAVILSFILSTFITPLIILGLQTSNLILALQIYCLVNLYCMLLSVLFVWIGTCCKGASTYQMVGSFLILSFGMIGTAGVIVGEQSKELLNISKIIPNYWFIKEFTDIIINGVS